LTDDIDKEVERQRILIIKYKWYKKIRDASKNRLHGINDALWHSHRD
jgi:hypothetical protein